MATDEATRLAALRSYRILDTEPEKGFDDLALLASYICGTPMAAITLIDEKRQWFKARVGIDVTETDRSVAFCDHAIKQTGIMTVPDARDDERFRNNPWVQGEPHIRFYAGATLCTPDGEALGTLCVIDSVPRELSHEQRHALDALRRQAEAQLQLRRNLIELRKSLDNVQRLSALMPYCSTCEMDMTIPANPQAIQTVSDGVVSLLEGKGWPEDDVMRVELALQEALANGIRHGCKGDPTKHVQCIVTHSDGELLIVVRDPGTGFDVTAVPDPLEGENILKASGRGVFLINQLMDEVAYADGGREVKMRKRAQS